MPSKRKGSCRGPRPGPSQERIWSAVSPRPCRIRAAIGGRASRPTGSGLDGHTVSASSQGARGVGRQYLRSPCVSPGTVDRDAAASRSLGIVRRHTPGQQGIKAACCYNHWVRGKYGERRSMAEDTEKLTALISETVAALTDLEGRLHLVQARVSGLGFFARGFVEKDVTGATGRTFSDWISAS